ncbi:hypothetical protein A2U01_0116691, partial [Trifolium medium]|nr:hypothetical protein [Trifolium medium]
MSESSLIYFNVSDKALKAEYPGFETFKAKWKANVGFRNFQSEVENKCLVETFKAK